MPILSNEPERIPVDMNGETIEFLFPPQHSPQMRKGINRLLKNRFVYTGTGDTKNMSYEARNQFFDGNCIGCDNLYISETEGEKGYMLPLHKADQEDLTKLDVSNWLEVIPDHWKAEVAGYFEESAVKSRKLVESE